MIHGHKGSPALVRQHGGTFRTVGPAKAEVCFVVNSLLAVLAILVASVTVGFAGYISGS